MSHPNNTPEYPEDGFTTNESTLVGKEGYFVTKTALRRIKAAAKFARMEWRSIAAHPKTARELTERIELDMPTKK